jgi:hypothetical protein
VNLAAKWVNHPFPFCRQRIARLSINLRHKNGMSATTAMTGKEWGKTGIWPRSKVKAGNGREGLL